MSRRDVKLPADQIVAARAYVLVLAILGQLRAPTTGPGSPARRSTAIRP